MLLKTKVAIGSLIGAVTIHVVFVACTGRGGTRTEQGADGGGIINLVMDAARDVLGMETSDAYAQNSDGGTSSCGPCTISGPIRTITADTDVTRLERGYIAVGGGAAASGVQKLVDGPFVLTDASLNLLEIGGTVVLFTTTIGTPCSAVGASDPVNLVTKVTHNISGSTFALGIGPIHGGRYFVSAGRTLCAYLLGQSNERQIYELSWAGFHPYSTM
jgi:hypothetical protein